MKKGQRNIEYVDEIVDEFAGQIESIIKRHSVREIVAQQGIRLMCGLMEDYRGNKEKNYWEERRKHYEENIWSLWEQE